MIVFEHADILDAASGTLLRDRFVRVEGDLIAQVCDLKPGKLSMLLGDTHIYKDHFDQVREQLTREPLAVPRLLINPEVKDIDGFKMDDFALEGYMSHESIKGEMSK
jgi:thymidylate synthase